ncbi:MAG TPA: DNA polymerase III subunit gamma/tau [Tepidisphaeraceae bacterium]|jgi:DNA polymerase-3 subunit gamma/tau|nr:DNA polymerase III subunit gamma/tau [Tepidisphaeraceae bacterium]
MAYTVLARRYRSTNFDEVVGQEHIAQTLKRAIASGRIAHAYLFCGTRGTGKTSTARILAKALNCEKSDGPTPDPCGVCGSCVGIARGDDMDVIEIDAASNTGVDNVRTLIENAQYRPARSRFKVYIIDEVHMLSKAAFNALLKTMEEPPGHVKFILATTEPEKVLPTILSRCQRYDFRNIPTAEIAAHLKGIAKQENIQADEDALLMVAKAGAGSMRDSLSLLDRLLSVGEKNLTLEMIEGLLGLPRVQLVFNLAQGIGEGDVKGVLGQVDKMLASGLSVDTLLVALVEHLRNLLILRTCGSEGAALVEVPGVSMKELAEQAGRFEAVGLTQDITILEELRRLMRQAMGSRALLDATLVRLALAEQFVSVGELMGRAEGIAGGGQKKKLEVSAESERPTSNVERSTFKGEEDNTQHTTLNAQHSMVNVDLDLGDDLPQVGRVWEESGPSLVEMMKQKTPVGVEKPSESNVEAVSMGDLGGVWGSLLGALQENLGVKTWLEQGKLVGFDDDGAAIISTASAFAKSNLDRNGKKDLIRDTLSKILNKPVGLRIVVEEAGKGELVRAVQAQVPTVQVVAANPAHRVVAEAVTPTMVDTSVRLTAELKDQLRQDPLVKGVLELLGGDIVKVDQG